MLKTKFCELFGVEYPIVCAGMGNVALANLAAAVSEAGGLGTIAMPGMPPDAMAAEISAARKITAKPIVVNQLIPFLRPGIFEMLATQPISAVTLFWGDPAEHIPRPPQHLLTIRAVRHQGRPRQKQRPFLSQQ